jgi:hypothetical protein
VVLLGVAAVGAAAVWLLKPGEAPPPAGLAIAGYGTEAQLEEDAKKTMFDSPLNIPYPIDEVLIEKQGLVAHLVREGDPGAEGEEWGKKLEWRLKTPVEAPAVKYAVEKMVKAFKGPTRSVGSKPYKADDARRFDLEPERRIHVTLKSKGAVWNGADLVIGMAQESETKGPQGEAIKDTWVMKAGDEGTVYRIAGKDLREPFDQALDELRDKKVFTVAAEDLTHVTIAAPDGSKVVLDGERKEKEAAKDDKPATYEVDWKVTEPAGFKADTTVSGVARSLANLRVRSFVAGVGASEKPLGEKPWRITAKTHDGAKTLVVLIADGGEEEEIWAQVEGANEYLKIDKYTSKNLQKTIADLRDKSLLTLDEAAVTLLTFVPEGGGAEIEVVKEAGAWKFTKPETKAGADVESALKSALTAKVTRFGLPAEEATAAAQLATPELTVRLQAGDKKLWIAFSKALDEVGDEKNQRWARVTEEGQPPGPLVLVADYTAKRFQKSLDDIRQKKLYSFTKDDLQKLEISWPEGKQKLVMERPPEAPSLVLLNVPAGKKPKEALLGTVQNTLPALRVKKFFDTTKPEDVDLVDAKAYVITASLKDGKTVKLLVSQKKDDNDPYALTDQGPLAGQVFTLNQYQVDNLTKEMGELVE